MELRKIRCHNKEFITSYVLRPTTASPLGERQHQLVINMPWS